VQVQEIALFSVTNRQTEHTYRCACVYVCACEGIAKNAREKPAVHVHDLSQSLHIKDMVQFHSL
jgi:hypothetical protein